MRVAQRELCHFPFFQRVHKPNSASLAMFISNNLKIFYGFIFQCVPLLAFRENHPFTGWQSRGQEDIASSSSTGVRITRRIAYRMADCYCSWVYPVVPRGWSVVSPILLQTIYRTTESWGNRSQNNLL